MEKYSLLTRVIEMGMLLGNFKTDEQQTHNNAWRASASCRKVKIPKHKQVLLKMLGTSVHTSPLPHGWVPSLLIQ